METILPAAWTPASVRAARANATYVVLTKRFEIAFICVLYLDWIVCIVFRDGSSFYERLKQGTLDRLQWRRLTMTYINT